MNIAKYIYGQNWNIGFVNSTAEAFINAKSLKKIQWMKHKYRDRFFADPFILSVTDENIILFVEELEFFHQKGRLVELVVDRKTKKLKRRYVLLELDTHLSYPAILRVQNEVFVYPENGASGKLNMYHYDKENHSLVYYKEVANEPFTDATICEDKGLYWLMATKAPETQEKVYLYQSNIFTGPYTQKYQNPVVVKKDTSRLGGNFICVNKSVYRPAQNCVKRYGESLTIMKVIQFEPEYKEQLLFTLHPMSFKYNLGLHTINFYKDVCVIDGYGYLYPFIGRFYNFLSRIKNKKNGSK